MHIEDKISAYSPAGIYLLKGNNRNAGARYEIYSKLTIKTPERCHWRCSGVFIVNSEHISHLVLVLLLLTLNMQFPAGVSSFHCVKSTLIQRFSGQYFPTFDSCKSPYSFRMQENTEEKTSNADTFY